MEKINQSITILNENINQLINNNIDSNVDIQPIIFNINKIKEKLLIYKENLKKNKQNNCNHNFINSGYYYDHNAKYCINCDKCEYDIYN